MNDLVVRPRLLSLCTGIGGLDLAVDAVLGPVDCAAYVEGEAFCAAHLVAAMEAGALAPAPIWSDLRTFDARPLRGRVDIVAGGYPCQPFSVAGKRRGADDPRHLWPEIRRVLDECRPTLAVFENVAGHLQLGFEEVVSDLEGLGFRVAAGLFTAEEVGAPHRRERLFLVAMADAKGDRRRQREPLGEQEERIAPGRSGGELADADDSRPQGRGGPERGHADERATRSRRSPLAHRFPPGPGTRPEDWPADVPEPAIRRGADGLPNRVDRLRALGNAVVPQQGAFAIATLIEEML